MSHSIPLVSYLWLWLLISILLAGLQITAAVLLLRERGAGPWLMLCGGVISVLGPSVSAIGSLMGGQSSEPMVITTSSLRIFGSLLFGIGLLLHALHRRAQGNRIAELEAILAARHAS